jgi:hypothetical protein
VVISASIATLVAPGAAQAQQRDSHLFDRISIALEGSWAVMDTMIRLDSEALGTGTEVNFENDGGLDSSKAVPTLSFEWRVGRRHRLGGWWMDVRRDSTNTILKEIKFGDEVFPPAAEVRFLFETEEIALNYTYFLKLEDRHAFGIGGGFRILKTIAGLAALNLEITEEGDFTAPLPFLWLEYRYGIGPKWRLISDFGVFYIEIGDYSGSQIVLDAFVEYLAGKRLSVGFGIRGARVDADVKTGSEIAGDFYGATKMAIASARLFVRVRF